MPTVVAQNNEVRVVVVERAVVPSIAVRINTLMSVASSTSPVRVSSPGPQGAAGLAGGAYTMKTAAEALGGHRIVRATGASGAGYADANTVTHGDDVLGMTLGAVSLNAAVSIAANGQEVTEPSWSWTPLEPLFLGLGGLMTQTPPDDTTAAFSLVVGFATSPTSVLIRIGRPVYF
ncbi:MAG: hypothetical protein M3Q39_01590 [Actinomycetota bacterium]|nr:hypothetical protein [Actinomycetota bacterium]